MCRVIIKYLFIVAFLVIQRDTIAQDIHYTQYSFLPLLQNPASVGFFKGNMRFSSIYRNQWVSVPVNYNSLGFSYDLNFFENFRSGSKAGIGLNMYFDQAGDSKFQTLHLMLPIAYHAVIPVADNKLIVSVGVEGGIQSKSLSTSDLYYDTQFNGEVYDKEAANNETFTNLNVLNPDIGAGINFEFETENNLKIGFGFSLKHINNAEESFINSNIKPTLRQRYVVPIYSTFPLSDVWDMNVSYLFNYQNQSQEHLTGVLFGYYLNNIEVYKRKINMGVFYRIQDAISLVIQYETNNIKAGLSYDINASKFTKASSSYGGVELGFTYLIHSVIKPNLKHNKKCFVF